RGAPKSESGNPQSAIRNPPPGCRLRRRTLGGRAGGAAGRRAARAAARPAGVGDWGAGAGRGGRAAGGRLAVLGRDRHFRGGEGGVLPGGAPPPFPVGAGGRAGPPGGTWGVFGA